jgi:hypothetical protein
MCEAIEQVARPAIAGGAVLAHTRQETWPVRLTPANSQQCQEQNAQPACRCAHRDVKDFTFISIGARQDRPASGTKCADGESVVDPSDYLITFVGICIALAGVAYVFG